MVDLFMRETILAHLNTRTQDNVAKKQYLGISYSNEMSQDPLEQTMHPNYHP